MKSDLLKEIEEFIALNKMSEGTFGHKAIKNGRLVERLKKGRRVWPETEERIRQFMAQKKT